jgi:hypothetical protein
MAKKPNHRDLMRKMTEDIRKQQNAEKSRFYKETEKLPNKRVPKDAHKPPEPPKDPNKPKVPIHELHKLKKPPRPVKVPISTGTGRGRKGLAKPSWTAYEEKVLEDLAGEKSDEEITEILRNATSKDFTRSGVRKKRQRMGLKKCMGRGKKHLFGELDY